MDKFLSISNLTKIFNIDTAAQVVALKNINLQITAGEFIVLSGPSGSGKTTLLNIIGGLDSTTSGKVILQNNEINDMDESALSEVRRDSIGFVFQAYNLISVFSAKENIEYVLKLQKYTQQQCDTRVLEIAKTLGIETLLNKLPSQLSGGQQQRIAVARAVASKPKLILADEPTANLDSENANDLMEMMKKLNKQENITIIFSSHDPLVISKAKRLIKLKDGVVIYDELA